MTQHSNCYFIILLPILLLLLPPHYYYYYYYYYYHTTTYCFNPDPHQHAAVPLSIYITKSFFSDQEHRCLISDFVIAGSQNSRKLCADYGLTLVQLTQAPLTVPALRLAHQVALTNWRALGWLASTTSVVASSAVSSSSTSATGLSEHGLLPL